MTSKVTDDQLEVEMVIMSPTEYKRLINREFKIHVDGVDISGDIMMGRLKEHKE